MLVLVWNIKLPMIQELQLLLNTTVKLSTLMLIKLKFVVKMVLLMFILFKNSVVQTQVLPTTNVLWLRLAILLKKVTLSLTVHLWKVEKWPSVKTLLSHT